MPYNAFFFLFLALAAILFRDYFSNFSTGPLEQHFCEIILKSSHQHERRCHIRFISIFSSGHHLVQRNHLAILVQGNISVKLFSV